LGKISSNLDRMFDTLSYKHYEIRNISLLLIQKNWIHQKLSYEFEYYTHDRKAIFQKLKKIFYDIYIPGELYRKT